MVYKEMRIQPKKKANHASCHDFLFYIIIKNQDKLYSLCKILLSFIPTWCLQTKSICSPSFFGVLWFLVPVIVLISFSLFISYLLTHMKLVSLNLSRIKTLVLWTLKPRTTDRDRINFRVPPVSY